jgi:MFS transporter, PAT family, solute carrier family 33 (acetyl-CoA transportor), member 1
MSTRRSSKKSTRRQNDEAGVSRKQDMPARSLQPMAVSSSLDSIYISPRTPKTPRTMQNGSADPEEVELTLLDDDERRRAAEGLDADVEEDPYSVKRPISPKDKRAIILLCVLCEFPTRRLLQFSLNFGGIRPHTRSSSEPLYQINLF